jgi:hypothetical protein
LTLEKKMLLHRYIVPAGAFCIVFAVLCFVPLVEVAKGSQSLGTWPLWTAYFGLIAGLWDRAWDVVLFCAAAIASQVFLSSILPALIIWIQRIKK